MNESANSTLLLVLVPKLLLGNAYPGALLRKTSTLDPKYYNYGPDLSWEGIRGDSRLRENDW